jgi:hypothetical protein
MISGERHDERCPACEQAKHKKGSFKTNKEYLGTGVATKIMYWRLFCDGFGGQYSMGEESYQGAKGGFVFICPVSGAMKVKLYASTKQFPAILYQVLQEIESEGFAVRKMYVDTFIVNISKEAEDVAAMVDCTCKCRRPGGNGVCRACRANPSTNVEGTDGRGSSPTTMVLGIERSSSSIYLQGLTSKKQEQIFALRKNHAKSAEPGSNVYQS